MTPLGLHDAETCDNMRDFLANERTLLAYIRTALALFIVGVSLIYIEFEDYSVDLVGFGFIGLSLFVLGWGYLKFHQRRRVLMLRHINHSRGKTVIP